MKEDLLVGISIKERQRLMAFLNARARYERRIFVTVTKVGWDATRTDKAEGLMPLQGEV